MIQKRKKKYIPVCDICGAELEPEESFADARDMMKIANWKSRQISSGEWQHWCDECIYQDKLANPPEPKNRPKHKHNYYKKSRNNNSLTKYNNT